MGGQGERAKDLQLIERQKGGRKRQIGYVGPRSLTGKDLV